MQLEAFQLSDNTGFLVGLSVSAAVGHKTIEYLMLDQTSFELYGVLLRFCHRSMYLHEVGESNWGSGCDVAVHSATLHAMRTASTTPEMRKVTPKV